jgi:rod shape-determining protein MreD
MAHLASRGWCVATGLAVPALALASPAVLQLGGVGPAWAVLWLLPWALMDGPVSGIVVGTALGLVLDDLQRGAGSVVPALALLGWWWGRLGRRRVVIERSVSLALLAVLGSLLLGGTVVLQQLLAGHFSAASLQVLWAQALLTGLLAPLVCSLQVLLWRQLLPGAH